MSERTFTCPDGSEWRIAAATRSSPYRMELVLERVGSSHRAIRCEAEVTEVAELSDDELCFLVGNR